MISQVVESDFVLGSERFYCCVFQARPNNAFPLHRAHSYWHWREQCWNTLEAQTTASLSHSSFSLRVAPNLVVMFLLICRMFSKDSSSSTPPTWGGKSVFLLWLFSKISDNYDKWKLSLLNTNEKFWWIVFIVVYKCLKLMPKIFTWDLQKG